MKNRNVYYMNFVLTPIDDQSDNTNVHDAKQSILNETNDEYNDMVISNKEPIVSSVNKKRLNKTVECPKCGKSMNRKTQLYSHDCEKIKQHTTKPTTIIEVNAPVTDEDVELYLQKQEVLTRDNMISQRADKFNNMIRNAF